MLIDNIKIVMVGTTHAGNIGAAARAMHNMSVRQLALVAPECKIGEIAYARASGANQILDDLQCFDDLQSAIADCDYAAAASARRRSLSWPELDPHDLAQTLHALPRPSRAAIVFGREHSGLTNEEIQMCHAMLHIPSNPEFSSLNVAAAIQIVCYEVYRRWSGAVNPLRGPSEPRATSAELEGYFEHLQRVLLNSGFLDPDQPGQIMQRLRRLYLRTETTRNEINILRGILSAVDKPRDS
jgi:tRNA/rRNA methyltransferase/tRNA (cytidine32/uridine32-2'-O)-methyltransferase